MVLYEINTRCWLRELTARHGRPITLANVPEDEFSLWRQLGFTHIWLMGVWSGGPRARSEALSSPRQRQVYSAALPDCRDEDVGASPYAVAEYRVPLPLGGEEGLAEFRLKLHRHSLKLLLDFVPNHLGLDHPWISQQPDLFVQSPEKVPGAFPQQTAAGFRWLAHGKEPHSSAWTDTVQLDYRRPATRAAMISLLESIAGRCDGLRCDMAMLLLEEVFAKTWKQFPVINRQLDGTNQSAGGPPIAASEFWSEAIAAIKQTYPGFLFLAEAYWGLEQRLQALGFDYTYDKALYDRLVARDTAGAQEYLLSLPPRVLASGAHFLENHDEPRIASILSAEEQRAALLLILALPGLPLLHEGQLSGARIRLPVQLLRRAAEPRQQDIETNCRQLLATLPSTAVGRGTGELLRPRAAWAGNPTARNVFLIQSQAVPSEFDLVAVNLAPHRSQCYAPLAVKDLSAHNWSMKDLLGHEEYLRAGEDLQHQGLYLDLVPHAAQLFRFQPVG
jgi:glycosidase